MRAAVVRSFAELPRCEEFQDPSPQGDELLVEIKASALKNIERGIVSGKHYSAPKELPFVAGVDGAGVSSDGRRLYCGGARPPFGMMAQRAAVSPKFCWPVPDAVDDLMAAALPNAALSSWLPLQFRAGLQPGEKVLVLGATGVSGRLAVEIAKHLGAGRVVASGRNTNTLAKLDADAVIPLQVSDEELLELFVNEKQLGAFDVIVDFVWGRPAEVLLEALTGHDFHAAPHRTRYVQIGSMAGSHIHMPAEVLRSTALEMYGSGGGSVSHEAIHETMPKAFALAANGRLRIEVEAVPLADVEAAFMTPASDGNRVVIVP